MGKINSMIVPIRDYILLEKTDDEEIKTASGIIVAASDDKKQYHGITAEVIAVGPEVKIRGIKPGARIVVNRYDVIDVRDDVKTYGLIRGEEYVYALVKE